MARKRSWPRGVDPNLRAYLEAQERTEERAMKVERIRRRRDVVMSAAQAMAVNPLLTNAAVGLMGAGIASTAEVVRHYSNAGLAATRARNPEAAAKLDALKMPKLSLEWAGEGLMGIAALNQGVTWGTDILEALRGRSEAVSIAYDIPDSEGAALGGIGAAAGGGLPFRRANPAGE